MTALEHFACGGLITRGIVLVNTHPIGHVATEAGDDVEEVINDFRLRTMLLHLQTERRVHAHDHRFDLSAAFLSQQLKERADCLPAVALTNPQNTHPICIHDHRGVAMSLVQRKLVHH